MLPRAVLYAAVITICLFAIGLYQQHLKGKFVAFAMRLLIGLFFAAILLALVFYLFPQLYVGRGVLVISMDMSAAGIVISRAILGVAGMGDVLNLCW